MNPQTQDNLLPAIRGGALAFVKSALFAGQARQNGREELATQFESTAHVELVTHFAEVVELAWLVSIDYGDVCNAIRGQSNEVDRMYRAFAEQAGDAGDDRAAARSTEISRDEVELCAAFKAAMQELEAGSGTNPDMITAPVPHHA